MLGELSFLIGKLKRTVKAPRLSSPTRYILFGTTRRFDNMPNDDQTSLIYKGTVHPKSNIREVPN